MPIGTIGFGRLSVSSLNRVPYPPAKITTFKYHPHIATDIHILYENNYDYGVKQPLEDLKVKFFLQKLAVPILALLLFWQFWSSAYTADDSPNRLLRFWTLYDYGEKGFTAWIKETERWTSGWMQGQGRFFPTAVALNRGVFLLVESRIIYKVIQFSLVLLLAILISHIVSKVLNSKELSPLVSTLTLTLMQIRFDYDPYFSFSLLLTSTACLLFVLFLLLEKFHEIKARRKYAFVSFVIFVSFLAFTNYEYSIVLVPAILILYFRDTKKLRQGNSWIPAVAVTSTAFMLLAYTFFILRPKRENKIPSYEFSLELIPFLKAFLAQILSPIPFFPHIFLDIQVTRWQPLWILVLFFLTLFFLLPHRRLRIVRVEVSNIKALALSGVYFVSAPSFLVAITRRWQLDSALTIGKSYLPVIFVMIGYVLLFTSLFAWLSNQFNFPKATKSSRVTQGEIKILRTGFFERFISSLIIAIFLWVSSSHNLSYFGDGVSQDQKLEIIKVANEFGILDSVEPGDRIISWEMNDATEINKGVFSVFSGRDLSMLNQPRDILPDGCAESQSCDPFPIFERLSLTQNRLIGGSRKEITEVSSFHILDVIFYLPDAAIFSISPLKLSDGRVIVDRSKTRLIWVIDEKSRILGRTLGKNECVVPMLDQFILRDNWRVFIEDVAISETYDLLSAIDKGKTCDEVTS